MSSIGTTNDRASTFLSLVSRLRSERAEWATAIEEWNEVSVVVGHGFIAYCEGLAIRVEGNSLVPVRARPGVVGISNVTHLSREDAEQIAALHPGGFRAVYYRDLPSIRIAEIDETIAAIEALSAN